MARVPILKTLDSTRLASGHGGWIYCESCGENIGYLCYVTYDDFRFRYTCQCGACGSMHLAFADSSGVPDSGDALVTVRNRFCCPNDQSPLFTVLHKKLASYTCEVVCAACKRKYIEQKTP